MLAMISGWLIAIEGWSNALLIITLIVSCAGLLAFGVRGKPTTSYPDVSLSLRSALRDAFHHRGYWLLNFGFFVCGFHVTFVATHLPSYLSDLGYTGMLAATAIGAIGLANILGTLSCGLLGGIYSKKYILSILYFLRSIVIAVFIFIPISETSVIVFAALLGLLWLGTVPLTSGLVVQIFGSRYLGTLFGIVFFSHQIGGFFGAWLGGKLYDSTNSYDLAWYIAILLGVFAAIIHLPINDRPFKYAN